MWEVLAKGSCEDFLNSQPPMETLPHKTPMELIIETQPYLPLAPMADLWGAEWVARQIYQDSGAIIKNVRSDGWTKVVVEMESNAVHVILLILAIIAIIGGLAYLVRELRLLADIAGGAFPWLIAAGIAVVGLFGYAIYQRTKT